MKIQRFLLITMALGLFCPSLAQAQNTTAGTAFRILIGQSPVRFNLTDATTERWFDFQSRIGRSYCIEVTSADDGVCTSLLQNDPTVTVYSDAGGTPPLIPVHRTVVPEGEGLVVGCLDVVNLHTQQLLHARPIVAIAPILARESRDIDLV